MNTENITYRPISTEFTWTGDGYGQSNAVQFKQLKRDGDIVMYERRTKSNVVEYEVFRVKRHNGYAIKDKTGKENRIEPAEIYPGAASFGKNKHAYHIGGIDALARAEERFAEMVKDAAEVGNQPEEPTGESVCVPVVTMKKKEAKKEAKNVVMPVGEFTMKDLIAQTGLLQPELYQHLRKGILDGSIVEVRRVSTGRGRPSAVYTTKLAI